MISSIVAQVVKPFSGSYGFTAGTIYRLNVDDSN